MDNSPLALLTGDVNGPAGLRGQAMHHGQAQSRAFTDAFGRQKRLHRPGERRGPPVCGGGGHAGLHAGTTVGAGDDASRAVTIAGGAGAVIRARWS